MDLKGVNEVLIIILNRFQKFTFYYSDEKYNSKLNTLSYLLSILLNVIKMENEQVYECFKGQETVTIPIR